MGSVAPEQHTITTEETRNVSIDCSSMLDDSETLTGTPTVDSIAGLTITNEQVNSSAVVINGASVGAGLAIQFTVSSTTIGLYTIELKCGTSESQTVEGEIRLRVRRSKV